jgi:hypothetical protein
LAVPFGVLRRRAGVFDARCFAFGEAAMAASPSARAALISAALWWLLFWQG